MHTTSKLQSGNGKQKVLIVEDHPLMRQALCDLINREPDLLVSGEADDAAIALTMIFSSTPNLAIVDLTLKTSHGLELIKDIRARGIRVPVLVLSLHNEEAYAERVWLAGAQGYVDKRTA